MSAGEAELQEPRITFLATLPEVMRHIERWGGTDIADRRECS